MKDRSRALIWQLKQITLNLHFWLTGISCVVSFLNKQWRSRLPYLSYPLRPSELTEDGFVVFKLLRDDGDCSGDLLHLFSLGGVLAALHSTPRNCCRNFSNSVRNFSSFSVWRRQPWYQWWQKLCRTGRSHNPKPWTVVHPSSFQLRCRKFCSNFDWLWIATILWKHSFHNSVRIKIYGARVDTLRKDL